MSKRPGRGRELSSGRPGIRFQPGSVASRMTSDELRSFRRWLDDANADARVLERQLRAV